MMKSFEVVKRYEVQASDAQEAVDKLIGLEIAGNQFLVETGTHVREVSFPQVGTTITPTGYERIFSA